MLSVLCRGAAAATGNAVEPDAEPGRTILTVVARRTRVGYAKKEMQMKIKERVPDAPPRTCSVSFYVADSLAMGRGPGDADYNAHTLFSLLDAFGRLVETLADNDALTAEQVRLIAGGAHEIEFDERCDRELQYILWCERCGWLDFSSATEYCDHFHQWKCPECGDGEKVRKVLHPEKCVRSWERCGLPGLEEAAAALEQILGRTDRRPCESCGCLCEPGSLHQASVESGYGKLCVTCYSDKAQPTDGVRATEAREKLEQDVRNKLHAEGLTLGSPWDEIQAVLERTVAPERCIEAARRMVALHQDAAGSTV
jgi:hypothetical protein